MRARLAAIALCVSWSRALADGPLRDAWLQKFEFEALVDAKSWQVSFVAPPPPGGSEPRPRRRSAEEILRDECDKQTGRVGMWKG